MELKWLEDFVAVHRLGSFSKAARARNVTQPAFSRRIQSLENWLGAPLFDRSVLPVMLTHFGEEFLPYVEQIIRTATEAQQDFRAQLSADKHLVRVSALHSLSIHLVPQLVAPFLADHAGARVEISSSIQGVDAHFDALDSGMAHILVAYANSWHLRRSDLITLDIVNDSLIPVVSRDFVSRFGMPDIEDGTTRVPLIAYPPFTFSHRLMASKLDRLGGRAVLRATSSLGETQKALVAESVGCGWLLEGSIRRELDEGRFVRCVRKGSDFECPIQIIAIRRSDLDHKLALKLWDRLADDPRNATLA